MRFLASERNRWMLNKGNMVLVVLDVQGNLARMVYQQELLFHNLQTLIHGIQLLEVPIILVEHAPRRLGPIAPEIQELLPDEKPIRKETFSCTGCKQFMSRLKKLQVTDVVLAGLECHVCVYQSAMGLLDLGFRVQVVVDAVSSRTKENRRLGLDRMCLEGVRPTGTEMLLFDVQKVAQGAVFRELVRLVK
jgi:nicotinamidase-related amidase